MICSNFFYIENLVNISLGPICHALGSFIYRCSS